MPVYKPEINKETEEVTHKFIFRVYKDGEVQRRVYKDKDLVYSLYDVNYHYGQSEETEGEEESGAYIPEDQKIVKNDVWGHTTELNTVEYDDEEYGLLEYWEWYKEIVNGDDDSIDDGFIKPSSYLGTETDQDNTEDYNLYIDLMRSSVMGNKVIEWNLEFADAETYEEAVSTAEATAYDNGADVITGFKVTSY